MALQSAIGTEIREALVDVSSEHTYLALFMLQEKRDPTSFWKPYLDLLRVPSMSV